MIAHVAGALGLAAVLAGCGRTEQRVVLPGAAELSASEPDTGDAARVRRVWARAQDYATPSPDGRYFAFVDWSTGDVAMHDLVTGQDRRLTNKGTWTQNGSWAEEPYFSPDGRRVAYSYGNVLGPGAGFQYELRVVEVGDTTPRVLVALTSRDRWIAPMDWSASQGILVEINRGDAAAFATDLAVVNPTTGALRVLRTYSRDQAHPHDGAFSPDGRFVVYRQGKDVRVMTADARRDASLGMDVRWVLGWTPDGRAVLVHASAHSTTGIWSVPVADGRRSGEPVLVRGGMPALLPGGFARGNYYYVVPVDAPKIYTASIDIPSGRVLAPPVAITSPVDGPAHHPAWSPDGRSLAYLIRDLAERRTRIMLRASDGDEVRELATIPQEQVGQVLWSADGQALLVNSRTMEGSALFRVDIRTGAVSAVLEHAGQAAAVAPDGRLVYARREPNFPELQSGIFVRDLATGQEQRIAEPPGRTRSLAVSPDGRRIALVLSDNERRVSQLIVMPIEGGPTREILRAEYPAHLEHGVLSLPWTRDGRHVLVVRSAWSAVEQRALLAVPVDGGEPIRIMDFPGPGAHPTLHPDGRRLAYSDGELRMELWVLEDLTPESR